MKKLFMLILIMSFFNLTPFFASAENGSFVKVIYSNINIYSDTNINEDFNLDGVEDIICSINYGIKLELKNENIIIGNDGFNYYCVKVNEQDGYVFCSQVLPSNYKSPIKDLDGNATLKSAAEVYVLENSVYNKTETILPKNQKIKILDGYNNNSQYTRIQYKDQEGQILTAYIKTETMKVSGISRSTIGAIIIVFTTVSLVLVVFGIKGKNKKKLKGEK